jgi:anti-anti-sigma factor
MALPTIVAPEGRLDSNTSSGFEKAVRELLAGGAQTLLMDFSGLDYMSSAGLRIVLLAAKRMKACGGKLVICGLNESITEVFEISGFLASLNVVSDRPTALQAFAPA